MIRSALFRLALSVALLLGAGAIGVSQPDTGALTSHPTLRIIHVDVGQGDATIIIGPPPDSRVMLIDAGDTPRFGHVDGGLRVLHALAKSAPQRLDYAVLTHYDADHAGGYAGGPNLGHSVLLGFDSAPGLLGVDDDANGIVDWVSPGVPDRGELGQGDDHYAATTQFIDRGDSGVSSTRTNDSYRTLRNPATHLAVTSAAEIGRQFALGGGATATIVAGNGYILDRATRVANVNTENERSVGIWVRFREFDYLICGDLIGQPAGSENALLEPALGQALTARGATIDVLHVNHHGAANGTAPAFIDTLRPGVAIISVGDGNDYGHPAAATLSTLFDRRVSVYQTEGGARSRIGESCSIVMGGHALIETDGRWYDVNSWGTLGEAARGQPISHHYSVRSAPQPDP